MAAIRLTRAASTQSAVRDEVLRRHVGHVDRELALAVTERLAAPQPADDATAAALDAVLREDLRHAARILAALATIDGPADEPLRRALRDELDLAADKVRAEVLARHGSSAGPVLIELGDGGRLGDHARRRDPGRARRRGLEVLLGPDGAGPVLALLRPDLSIAERHLLLPMESGEEVPSDVAGWLRELVEDPRGTWRSSWLRACAVHAARARGLLETLDPRPGERAGRSDHRRGPARACRRAGPRAIRGWILRTFVLYGRPPPLWCRSPRGRPPFRTGRAFCLCCSGSLGGLMTTGTIKKVIADRGFGFITAEDAKEYFFHRDGLDSTLNFDRLTGGEKVEFEIEQGPKGPRAKLVHAAA